MNERNYYVDEEREYRVAKWPSMTEVGRTIAEARERIASDKLDDAVAAGRVPDWPEWSRQMASVPL